MNNISSNFKNVSENRCPGCGSKELEIFYNVKSIPVHGTSIMLTREDAVKSPVGDLALGFCFQCGFITNTVYNPSFLDEVVLYEDQQGFSSTFKTYINELSQHLINKYDLHNKGIVEIGCGKGDFLKILCHKGPNTGIGIDPLSNDDGIEGETSKKLTFIQEYFSIKHGKYISNFLCCRHTLEHIHLTHEFLQTVRKAIGNKSGIIVFFEVPDVTRILQNIAFWDIYYEHCSYFSPGSLARVFRESGFKIINLKKVYDSQYLTIEAIPDSEPYEKEFIPDYEIKNLIHIKKSFSKDFDKLISTWTDRLQFFHKMEKRIIIWGSGSKCVAFISTLRITDEVKYIIDINPHRHGKFIPGSGKEIKSPLFLKEYRPDLVIVMNSIYIEEIKQMLDDMAIVTEVMSV